MNRTSSSLIVVGLCVLGTLSCGSDPGPAPPQTPEELQREQPAAPQVPPQVLEAQFEAVERDPSDPEAHHRLALALYQAGRREEAIGHFEVLLQLKPAGQHLVELGVAYASVSRLEEAEATFRAALEETPGQPTILHHLANLARSRGDTAGAIELYRQALESDPGYLMARFHLAETQRQAQQFPEAYRSYEKVLELAPAPCSGDFDLLKQAFINLVLNGLHIDNCRILGARCAPVPECAKQLKALTGIVWACIGLTGYPRLQHVGIDISYALLK